MVAKGSFRRYRRDMAAGTDQIGLQHARATFARATVFLGNGLSMAGPGGALAIAGPHRCKVIGNSLRELDRFLNLLIDEIAAIILEPGISADLKRQRNTPNKLRAVRAAMVLPSPDHARLRAIGRSRDCLFHCGGIVRRGDLRGDIAMTAGWSRADAAAPARVAMGERLSVGADELAETCRFYDGVVRDLLAAFADHRRPD